MSYSSTHTHTHTHTHTNCTSYIVCSDIKVQAT